jgi:hypothetical protein
MRDYGGRWEGGGGVRGSSLTTTSNYQSSEALLRLSERLGKIELAP